MIDSKILLASAQTGNADSFGTLYSMYSRELYLYALKLLGNREDAEDAVQQASLEVYTHLKSIRKPESFKAYYFKALANASRSMLSKKKIHIVSDDEIPEIPDGTDVQRQTEESTGIDSALRKLSDDEMAVIATLECNNRLVKGQVFLWPGANDWHDLWDEDGTIVSCTDC